MIEGSIINQVDETVEFIKKNMHVRFEITGEPQRKEIWDYPLPALREAVVNAICHRDYGDGSDIQIKIFENELQVWSPGFLPFGVTVEDLLDPEHTSKPRNKLIAQIFYDLGLIERYGSGIQRILEACREAGLPQPLLENFSGGFRIKFTVPRPITPQVTPQVMALVENLKGEASRDELMEKLSLKDREHFRKTYLVPSLDMGLIRMTIPDKPQSSKQRYVLTEKGRQRTV